jgi:hypothetical protein
MKPTLMFILSVLWLQNLCAQNNLAIWNLKGNLSQLIEVNYSVQNGIKTDSIIEWKRVQFDTTGNVSQIETKESKLKDTRKYFFDRNGFDTLCIVYRNDTINHKWKRIIREQNQVKRLLLDQNDSVSLETLYFYNHQNQNIRQESYDESGLTLKVVNVYDSTGVLMQEHWYNKQGVLTETWNYIYDREGNETENIGIDIEENTFYHDIYYFNKQKEWIKYEELDLFGNVVSTSEWIYEYDKWNNWISEKKIENGDLIRHKTREYIYK